MNENETIQEIRVLLSAKASLENFIRILAISQANRDNDTVQSFVENHINDVYLWTGNDVVVDSIGSIMPLEGMTVKVLGFYFGNTVFEKIADFEVHLPVCIDFKAKSENRINKANLAEIENTIKALMRRESDFAAAASHIYGFTQGRIVLKMRNDQMRDTCTLEFFDREKEKVVRIVSGYERMAWSRQAREDMQDRTPWTNMG